MQTQSYELFRLRQGQTIVGYQRYVKPGRAFYSKDRLWWESKAIDFHEKDAFVDLKDKNRHYLFENDMVSLTKASNKASDLWVLIFHAKKKCYTALHCQHFEEMALATMKDQGVFLQSYLFLNPHIQNVLITKRLIL